MLYLAKTDASALVDIEGKIIVEVEEALHKLGLLETTDNPIALKEALKTFHLQENFDDKYREDNKIDIAVLRFMKGKAGR
ncbi:putative peptidoglycan binding domain-containing protein [Bacillus sp. FJAT-45037]|uniref:putative peptidoglycan binding domain-containing protein n=1 Tax=Bacillus sp. FJAT-45037 TaxID=2011007 RepID=UPI002FCD8EFC